MGDGQAQPDPGKTMTTSLFAAEEWLENLGRFLRR